HMLHSGENAARGPEMSGPVEVQVEPTPNPNSLKFTVNREVWSGRARTVTNRDDALGLPLAARLLGIPGVKSLFFLRAFITVTRHRGGDWQPIADAVKQAIEEHYQG